MLLAMLYYSINFQKLNKQHRVYNMISTLRSDEASFILSLPLGKPNTKIPLYNRLAGKHPHVAQSPQKGPACFFYGMNILRKRIGPNSGPDYMEARRVEKVCSDFNKERTLLDREIKIIAPRILKDLSNKGWSLEKKTINEVLIPYLKKELSEKAQQDSSYNNLIFHFDEFCKQNECEYINIYLENKYNSSEEVVYAKFFKSMNVIPEEYYRECVLFEIRQKLANVRNIQPSDISELEVQSFVDYYPKWEQVKPRGLHSLYQLLSSKTLGFKTSKWKQSYSIDELQKCLKEEGPLIVGGQYGESLYFNEPTVTETIAGRPIYSWKPSDRRTFNSDFERKISEKHTIVVIGAAKGGTKKGFVYFVDPKDGSDPENPLQQKIYKISYENFISNITDIRGAPAPSDFGVALYYPKSPE